MRHANMSAICLLKKARTFVTLFHSVTAAISAQDLLNACAHCHCVVCGPFAFTYHKQDAACMLLVQACHVACACTILLASILIFQPLLLTFTFGISIMQEQGPGYSACGPFDLSTAKKLQKLVDGKFCCFNAPDIFLAVSSQSEAMLCVVKVCASSAQFK